MQINTNLNSIISANAMQSASSDISDSVKRISTGNKLAADDPAAIGAAARLKAQIGSLSKANDTVNKGIGVLQMMDSSLAEVANILSNLKDLAVASNNAFASTDDKANNQLAYADYLTALDKASANPVWGATALLTSATTQTLRVGSGVTNTTTINTYNTTSTGLSLNSTEIATGGASAAETAIDTAINTVAGYQARVGSQMKTLQSIGNVNDAVITGATSAYSALTSTDLARETASLAASQIRQNAAAAMFAQSNTMSREVVSYLLKGV